MAKKRIFLKLLAGLLVLLLVITLFVFSIKKTLAKLDKLDTVEVVSAVFALITGRSLLLMGSSLVTVLLALFITLRAIKRN